MYRQIVKKKETISFKVLFLILSIIFSFINKFKYGGGISSILLFIIGFGVSLSIEPIKLKLNRIHVLLYLFWLLTCISTILSPFVEVKQDIVSFMIAVIFFTMVTAINYNSREIKCILISYIATAIISSLNIIYNVLINHQATWHRFSTSFFGVDKDPNYASAFILPTIMILLYPLLHSKVKKHKWLYLVALAIITIGSVCTGSRAAFLFVILCYTFNFAVVIVKPNKNSIKTKITLIFLISIIVFSWNLVKDYLPDSLITRTTSISSYKEDTIRISIWKDGIKVFYDNPIIGVGLNGENTYLLENLGYNSHNVYLDILTGTGLIGSFIFILILFNLVNVKKEDKPYFIGLVVVMLGPLFFINGFNTPNFWIPLILLGVFQKYSLQTITPIYEWI